MSTSAYSRFEFGFGSPKVERVGGEGEGGTDDLMVHQFGSVPDKKSDV